MSQSVFARRVYSLQEKGCALWPAMDDFCAFCKRPSRALWQNFRMWQMLIKEFPSSIELLVIRMCLAFAVAAAKFRNQAFPS